MSIYYQIDKEAGWVLTVVEGEWSFGDHQTAFEALLADPGFEPGMNALFDASEATAAPTAEDLQALLELIRSKYVERGSKYKAALVAADDLGYAVSRMLESMSHDSAFTVRTFRARKDAEAWLSSHGQTPK